MTGKILVLSTCESEADARRLALHLLELRLAACVNVIPGARSFYWWEGKIEDAAECLLVIKSARDLFPRLSEELARVHPYKVPEIIALPIDDGAAPYLDWIDRELGLRDPGPP